MRIFIPASPAGYFEKYFAGGKKSFRSLTRRSSLKEFEFSFQYPEPMKNLLRETLEALAKNGKNVADVEWVGFLQTLFSGWDWPAAYMDWADFEI